MPVAADRLSRSCARRGSSARATRWCCTTVIPGDVSGDKSAVVGYLAAAIGTFSDDERTRRQVRLLRIARQAMTAHVTGAAPVRSVDSRQSAGLHVAARADVFVTIYHAGELRGCIGHIEADDLLPKSSRAARSPRAAKTRDSRPFARRNCR